jgi:hypothetical protein
LQCQNIIVISFIDSLTRTSGATRVHATAVTDDNNDDYGRSLSCTAVGALYRLQPGASLHSINPLNFNKEFNPLPPNNNSCGH